MGAAMKRFIAGENRDPSVLFPERRARIPTFAGRGLALPDRDRLLVGASRYHVDQLEHDTIPVNTP